MREIDLDFLFTNLTPNVACVRTDVSPMYLWLVVVTFGA